MVTGVYGLSGLSAAQHVAQEHRTGTGNATTQPLDMAVIIALEILSRHERVQTFPHAPLTASGTNGPTGPSAL